MYKSGLRVTNKTNLKSKNLVTKDKINERIENSINFKKPIVSEEVNFKKDKLKQLKETNYNKIIHLKNNSTNLVETPKIVNDTVQNKFKGNESKFSLYSQFNKDLRKKNTKENSYSFGYDSHSQFQQMRKNNYTINEEKKHSQYTEHPQYTHDNLRIETVYTNKNASYIDYRDISLLNTVKNQTNKNENISHHRTKYHIHNLSESSDVPFKPLKPSNKTLNLIQENKKAIYNNFQNIAKLKDKIKGASFTAMNSGNNSRNVSLNKGDSNIGNKKINTSKNSKTNLLELRQEINALKRGCNKKLESKTKVVTKNNSPANSPRELTIKPLQKNIWTNVGSRILTLNSESDTTEVVLANIEVNNDHKDKKDDKDPEIEINDQKSNKESTPIKEDIQLTKNEKTEYIQTIDIMKNYIKMLQGNFDSKNKELIASVNLLKEENSDLKKANNKLHEKVKDLSRLMLNMYHKAKCYDDALKSADKVLQANLIQLLEENNWLRAICKKEISNAPTPLNQSFNAKLFQSPVKDKSDDIIFQIESELSYKLPYNKSKPKRVLNDTINFRGETVTVKYNADDWNKSNNKNNKDFNNCQDDDKDELPSKDSSSSIVLVTPIIANDTTTQNTTDIVPDTNIAQNNKKLQKLSLYKTTPRLYLFNKSSQEKEKEVVAKYK